MKPDHTILEVVPGALSDYYDWTKEAKHGDILVYHIGDLQFDRSINIPASDHWRADQRQRISSLNTIADRIYEDAKAGLIRLTQKRIDNHVFEYRAHRVRTEYPGSKASVRNDDLVPA